MGSPGIATAPRITITMAITIANTGRSIKKRATCLGSLPRFIDVRDRPDGHSGAHGEQAFHHDSFAWFQAVFDQPGIADAVARFDDSGFDFIIRSDDVDG